MNIENKKLTSDLTMDYINFFEHVAFTDNEEWAGCYCTWYHWNDVYEEECNSCKESGGPDYRKNLAIRLIENGTLQGYLAYVDGSVVGWCNVNDKNKYDGLKIEKWPDIWENVNSTDKVKSIVCYAIEPQMRRKGIATQLLKRICEDSSVEGFTYVEAYPGKAEKDIHRNYHGPYSLYEKCGFTLQKELTNYSIVRKCL